MLYLRYLEPSAVCAVPGAVFRLHSVVRTGGRFETGNSIASRDKQYQNTAQLFTACLGASNKHLARRSRGVSRPRGRAAPPAGRAPRAGVCIAVFWALGGRGSGVTGDKHEMCNVTCVFGVIV